MRKYKLNLCLPLSQIPKIHDPLTMMRRANEFLKTYKKERIIDEKEASLEEDVQTYKLEGFPKF